MRSILVAEYFAFVVGPALGLTLNDLYPFGDQAGDTAVIKNDDGGSPEIFISTLFPFFNHQHTKLIVSNYISCWYFTGYTFLSDSISIIARVTSRWVKE